jgi:hypothetical protein
MTTAFPAFNSSAVEVMSHVLFELLRLPEDGIRAEGDHAPHEAGNCVLLSPLSLSNRRRQICS